MEILHAEIHKLKDQTQEKILEAQKHYSDACLDIFEDDSRDKLIVVQVVVEKFQKKIEEASNDDHIRQAFINEEAMKFIVKLLNCSGVFVDDCFNI